MYTHFRQMPVWQKAHELSGKVFELSNGLPRSEDYGLTSQIRRSSNSVAGNIAEGYGRRTKKDKAYFYTVARGSAFETQNHLLYGKRVGYFDEEETKRHIEEYNELIFELNKIVNVLG